MDYQLAFEGGRPELRLWAATVPAFAYSRSVPYFQMLVPTVDTVRALAWPGLAWLLRGRCLCDLPCPGFCRGGCVPPAAACTAPPFL
jgi:hypothetical protein